MSWGPLIACLGLIAPAGNALADYNPYYVGLSLGYAHDSNVYAIPDAIGDSYLSTGLVAGLDQPIGRQRLHAKAIVRNNRYRSLDALNNTSYAISGGLDFATIEKLSGSLTASVNQNLAFYSSTVTGLQLTRRNIEKSRQIDARVQWGGLSLLSLESTLSHRELGYSAIEYAGYEVNQDVASLGVSYRSSSQLQLGAAVRHSRGEYPKAGSTGGGFRPVDFRRNDLDLTATWRATGKSVVSGRLSVGKQSYSGGSVRDFSGTTGSLNWDYRPTGKLTLSTWISRDTGLESSFNAVDRSVSSADNSRITSALALSAGYEVTSKVKISAGTRFDRRSLENRFAVVGVGAFGAEGTDSSRRTTLGGTWAFTRNWQFACDVSVVSRDASDSARIAGLSYSYKGNTVACSTQFVLQ